MSDFALNEYVWIDICGYIGPGKIAACLGSEIYKVSFTPPGFTSPVSMTLGTELKKIWATRVPHLSTAVAVIDHITKPGISHDEQLYHLHLFYLAIKKQVEHDCSL